MADKLPPVIAELQAEIEAFAARIDEAKAKLGELAGTPTEVTVGADTAEANERLDTLHADLIDISNQMYDAHVEATADTAEANAKLDEIQAKLDALDHERADPKVHADTGNSESELSSMAFKIATLGPLAGAAATMIGGAFMALPGILAGASAGFGALFVGIHNISAAISAYTSAQQQAGMTGIQMAQQQISNAQTLSNAASQVASAQVALSQAQVQAYDQVHQAQEQVTLSEQQLQDAEASEMMAQRQLTEARMAARFALDDYKNQMADVALAVSAAEVAVQQAQLALQETIGNPAATQLQKEQAQIAYQQAVQQVTDLQTRQSQLGQEAALAAQKGVDGSDQVVQAQQNVKDAQNQVANSQQASSDAQMYLAQAQVSATQQVEQAQRQLTQALQDQKYAEEQVALSMAAPVGALSQLQAAMAKLSPAGQAFVTWWHQNMTPVLHDLASQDQGVLLPGLEGILKTLQPYLQAFGPILKDAAGGFVAFGQSVAAFLSSPQGLAEFQATMANGLGFMSQFGQAIVDVMKALGSIGSQPGAVQALGKAVVDIAQAFAKWASTGGAMALVDAFTQLAPLIGQVIDALGPMAGVLAGIPFGPVGMLIGALLPQMRELAPYILEVVSAFERAIIPALEPFLNAVAGALGQVLQALTPLFGPLGQIVSTIGTALTPIVGDLGGALVTLIQNGLVPWLNNTLPLLKPLLGLFQAVTPLIGPLTQLAAQAVLIATPFANIASVLIGPLAAALRVVTPLIKDFVTLITPIVNGMNALSHVPGLGGIFSTPSVYTGPPLATGGFGDVGAGVNAAIGGGASSPTTTAAPGGHSITVYAQTNASATDIANEIGWQQKTAQLTP